MTEPEIFGEAVVESDIRLDEEWFSILYAVRPQNSSLRCVAAYFFHYHSVVAEFLARFLDVDVAA